MMSNDEEGEKYLRQIKRNFILLCASVVAGNDNATKENYKRRYMEAKQIIDMCQYEEWISWEKIASNDPITTEDCNSLALF